MIAVFGSGYTHREAFADTPTQPPQGDDDVGDAMKSWTTVALRTFGTVDIEATVDMNSERLALTGKGMSDNMAGVIGQDVAAKLGQIVACSLQPAQPACAGFSGAFGSPETSAADYLEAFKEFRRSSQTTDVDEGGSDGVPPPME